MKRSSLLSSNSPTGQSSTTNALFALAPSAVASGRSLLERPKSRPKNTFVSGLLSPPLPASTPAANNMTTSYLPRRTERRVSANQSIDEDSFDSNMKSTITSSISSCTWCSGNSNRNIRGGLKRRPSSPNKQNEEFNLVTAIENVSLTQEETSASSSAALVPLHFEPIISSVVPSELKRSFGKVNPCPRAMDALFSEALKTMVNEKPVVPLIDQIVDDDDDEMENQNQMQEYQRRKLGFDKVPSQLLIDLSTQM